MAWMAWLTLPVKGGSGGTAPLTLRDNETSHWDPEKGLELLGPSLGQDTSPPYYLLIFPGDPTGLCTLLP